MVEDNKPKQQLIINFDELEEKHFQYQYIIIIIIKKSAKSNRVRL